MQTKPPRSAIAAHKIMVALQPKFSVNSARPVPDAALPMYVQKFKSPDINEILPNFAKCGGTIHVTTILTPYIQPVQRAEKSTDKNTLFPLEAKRKSADINPETNISPESFISFLTSFR